MPVSKEKKKEIWQDVSDAVGAKGTVVFANFHGLSMLETTAMRKELRKQGVNYLVAKKSITKKVLGGKNITGTLPQLDGELAIVSSDDQLAPASGIYSFQKKYDGKLSILGGIFEGAFKNKEEMTAIATIPPQDTLRGMFVNIINSPIQRFVIVLDAIAKQKQA